MLFVGSYKIINVFLCNVTTPCRWANRYAKYTPYPYFFDGCGLISDRFKGLY
jgi:hypothetical protein